MFCTTLVVRKKRHFVFFSRRGSLYINIQSLYLAFVDIQDVLFIIRLNVKIQVFSRHGSHVGYITKTRYLSRMVCVRSG